MSASYVVSNLWPALSHRSERAVRIVFYTWLALTERGTHCEADRLFVHSNLFQGAQQSLHVFLIKMRYSDKDQKGRHWETAAFREVMKHLGCISKTEIWNSLKYYKLCVTTHYALLHDASGMWKCKLEFFFDANLTNIIKPLLWIYCFSF